MRDRKQKFFGSFFQKRTFFLHLPVLLPRPTRTHSTSAYTGRAPGPLKRSNSCAAAAACALASARARAGLQRPFMANAKTTNTKAPQAQMANQACQRAGSDTGSTTFGSDQNAAVTTRRSSQPQIASPVAVSAGLCASIVSVKLAIQ